MNFYKLLPVLMLVFLAFPVLAVDNVVFNYDFNTGARPAPLTEGGSATWRYSNNYAETITTSNAGWIYQTINATDADIMSFSCKINYASTAYCYLGDAIGDEDDGGYEGHFPGGSGYGLMYGGGAGANGLWEITGSTETLIINYNSNTDADTILRADRNSEGGWKLYANNVLVESYATDTTHNSFIYTQSYLDNGAGGNAPNKIDDWNFIITTVIPLEATLTAPNGGEEFLVGSTQDINFSVTIDNNNLGSVLFDVNYAPTASQGTGTVIGQDLNAFQNCSLDTGNTYNCSYDWNTFGSAPGNYYLLLDTKQGANNSFDASDATFELIRPNIRVYVIDEISKTVISGASVTLDGNTLSTNAGGLAQFFLEGFNDSTYEITVNATDYTARTFDFDLNSTAIVDLNTLLLKDVNGINISFKLFKPDQVTTFVNAKVEVIEWENGIIPRAYIDNTNASGEITFFLNPNDANYMFRITQDNNTWDYNSMILSVLKPIDETTGGQIPVDWSLSVGGLATQDYNQLTTTQQIFIYANTTGKYKLTVGDFNNLYFDRKYFVNFVGGTTAENFQPYLVPKTGSISTTIKAVSGYTLLPLPDTEIRIYRTLAATGRTLVEQVITDGKGEAFVSLIENNDYEIEVYYNDTLQFTEDLTATSTTIWVKISNVDITDSTLGAGSVSVQFNPLRGKLVSTDSSLSQTIVLNDLNLDLSIDGITIWVTNTDVNGTLGNDVNLFVVNVPVNSSGTTTNSFDINSDTRILNSVSYDNNGFLVVYVSVGTSDGNFISKITYSPVKEYDFYRAIAFDLRPVFACSATNDANIPCPTLLLIALFVSIVATAGFAFETGLTGLPGLAGVFLVILGIFAYFTWVPPILYAGVVISIILIGLALAGRQSL